MQWSALEDHEVLQEDRVLTVASSGMSASKPTKGLELEHSQFFGWTPVGSRASESVLFKLLLSHDKSRSLQALHSRQGNKL